MKCKGIFGWLFGHKFKSFIIDYVMPKSCKLNGGPKFIESFANKKYVIRCKRCGLRLK